MNRPRTPEIPNERLRDRPQEERRVEGYVRERLDLEEATARKIAGLHRRVELQQNLA
ncbi:MAG: hypothetical protein PHI23_03405 [Candidatus Peribacteraceae bacterium]|nr:hypothetical protein [Candidatus Peribacteraceae bacterium]